MQTIRDWTTSLEQTIILFAYIISSRAHLVLPFYASPHFDSWQSSHTHPYYSLAPTTGTHYCSMRTQIRVGLWWNSCGSVTLDANTRLPTQLSKKVVEKHFPPPCNAFLIKKMTIIILKKMFWHYLQQKLEHEKWKKHFRIKQAWELQQLFTDAAFITTACDYWASL